MQEVIIYRNPQEKMMWDWWMAHPEVGYWFAIFLFGVIGLIAVSVVWNIVSVHFRMRRNRYNWPHGF